MANIWGGIKLTTKNQGLPQFDNAGNVILSKSAQEEKDCDYKCQFCQTIKTQKGEIFKDSGSLSQHEAWCRKNPNNRRLKKKEQKTPKPPKTSDKAEKIKKQKISPTILSYLTDEQLGKMYRDGVI